jgi:hypothetical protein
MLSSLPLACQQGKCLSRPIAAQIGAQWRQNQQRRMGQPEGTEVLAIVKASDVIIAVAD